jgi:hypothetical protein
MGNGERTETRPLESTPTELPKELPQELPLPTAQFRRKAWLAFQRALDPLAPPKALRLPRR